MREVALAPRRLRGNRQFAGARLGALGALLLAGLLVLAAAAPLIAPHDPGIQVGPSFLAPSWDHPLGTNDIGQDLFSELVFGARISLLVGIVAALAATALGTAVALAAGFFGGWVDGVLMRLVDVTLALPFLPLMIVIGVFLGPGLTTEILVVVTVIWARAARELRAQVLSVRERGHIQAALAMGAGAGYVIVRHLAPATFPLVIPQFVGAAKVAILLEASLSFLGLGDPTAKSWGTMLFFANARSAFLTDAWLWWVLPPGLGIATTVLAFAFLGYALEERARPRLRAWTPGVVAPRGRTRSAGPLPGSLRSLLIEDLVVEYATPRGPVRAVDGVTLTIQPGEVFGLVGESGSGKTTVAAAALGLLKPPAQILAGRVVLAGADLAGMRPAELRRVRGGQVALVPQSALNALNPVFTVGDQIAEAITAHQSVTRQAARARARELLELVGIPAGRAGAYPHEFSGGMRQRALIAMALANDPWLVIADEPTSSLDVILQAEILGLLADLRSRLGLALLLISHDLPIVLGIADRVAVMRAGRIVEHGPAGLVASRPSHTYTRQLLASVPGLQPRGVLVGAVSLPNAFLPIDRGREPAP